MINNLKLYFYFMQLYFYLMQLEGQISTNFPLGGGQIHLSSVLFDFIRTAVVGAAAFFLLHRVGFPYQPEDGT